MIFIDIGKTFAGRQTQTRPAQDTNNHNSPVSNKNQLVPIGWTADSILLLLLLLLLVPIPAENNLYTRR